MQRLVTTVVMLAFAGCLAPSGPGASTPAAGDVGAAAADPDDAAPETPPAEPQRASRASPEPAGRTWYLAYAPGNGCLEQEGLLVDASPADGACWHLPGLLLDAPRTFAGVADGVWPAGSAADGVLVLFGQAPGPSSLRVTLRAGGNDVGAADLDAGILGPMEQVEVPFTFLTQAAVGAGDDLEVVVSYLLPTAADYLVVGETRITLSGPAD
jgi:hypothetical protein